GWVGDAAAEALARDKVDLHQHLGIYGGGNSPPPPGPALSAKGERRGEGLRPEGNWGEPMKGVTALFLSFLALSKAAMAQTPAEALRGTWIAEGAYCKQAIVVVTAVE